MKIKNQNPNKKFKNKLQSKRQTKSKSKSQSKNTKNKFNPLDYLNALIELTNNSKTIKLKRNHISQKRDLSSALTIATPAMEKTISSQKIRSKSSLSQYRKKSTNVNTANIKQVLNINLNNYIITQDDNQSCIKFNSQSSALSSIQQSPSKLKQTQDANKIKQISQKLYKLNNTQLIDYNFYAKKIQNAWRSYQTYKMVHKYYKHFKKQKKHQEMQQFQQRKMQYTSRGRQRPSEIDDLDKYNLIDPTAKPYLSDYYDIPISQSDLINDEKSYAYNQQAFQKTLKLKFKKPQQKEIVIDEQKNEQIGVVHSQSGSTDLNLTRKFNQIKVFLENENNNCQQNQFMDEVPTVQIIKSARNQKSVEPFSLPEIRRQQIQQSKMQKQQTLNRNINYLDRTPTLKQRISSQQSKIQNYAQSDKKEQNLCTKNSLVQKIIKQQADRYNELLSMIKISKNPQKGYLQQSQDKGKNILCQLMSKLEQNKLKLQKQIEEVKNHQSSSNSINQKNDIKIYQKGEMVRINRQEPRSNKIQRPNPKFQAKNIRNSKQSKRDKLLVQQKANYLSDKNSDKYSDANSLNIITFDSKQIYKSFQSNELSNYQGSNQKQLFKGNSSNQKKEQFILKQKQNGFHNKELEQDHFKLIKKFEQILKREQEKIQDLKGMDRQTIQIQINNCSSIQSSHSSNNQLNSELQNQIPYQSKSNEINQQNDSILGDQAINTQQPSETSSIYSFSSLQNDKIQKLFKQHLHIQQLKKQKSIKNLNNLYYNKKTLSKDQFEQRIKQIEQKYGDECIKIKGNQKQYVKVINKIKIEALEFQKDVINSNTKKVILKDSIGEQKHRELSNLNSSSSKSLLVRKSFSTQSIVLKCILKQPIFLNEISMKNHVNYQEKVQITQKMSEQELQRILLDKSQEFQQNQFDNQNISLNIQKNSQDSEIRNDIASQKRQTTQDLSQSFLLSSLKKCQRKQNIQNNPSYFSNDNDLPKDHNNSLQDKLQQPFTQKQKSQNQSQLLKSYQKLNQNKSNNSIQVDLKTPSLKQFQCSQEQLNGFEEPQKQYQKQLEQEDSNIEVDIQQQNQINSLSPRSMVKCSQELEKLIEKELLNQILQEIYMKDSILLSFKALIEEIFEFNQIKDQDIMSFVQKKLPTYYKQVQEQQLASFKEDLLQKANQKINPTSVQILRLIRDFDFQINQYELILSQDIFKKVRKAIEDQYANKISERKNKPIKPNTSIKNLHVIDKVYERESIKRAKIQKYLQYERDLKIMYMKAVFNCLNELLIQEKSIATHMNCRSTIGTGQLTLALKQFNLMNINQQTLKLFFQNAHNKIQQILKNKCMLPSFKNYKDVQIFQNQMLKLIKIEIDQTEYKWLNYMDEVLQIWNIVANNIVDDLWKQATQQILLVYFDR